MKPHLKISSKHADGLGDVRGLMEDIVKLNHCPRDLVVPLVGADRQAAGDDVLRKNVRASHEAGGRGYLY